MVKNTKRNLSVEPITKNYTDVGLGGTGCFLKTESTQYLRLVEIQLDEESMTAITVRQRWEDDRWTEPTINWNGFHDRSAEETRRFSRALGLAATIAGSMEDWI